MFLTEIDEHLRFTTKVEDYRTFAIKVHGNQTYGSYPYAMHLSLVENALVDCGFDSYEYRAAAWLHDAVEDCNVAPKDIQRDYGTTVANLVYACSGQGETRKIRNECIYTRLKARPEAAPVKWADRYVNMRYGLITKSKKLGMYVDEFPEFSENVRELLFPLKNGHQMWNDLEDVYEQAKATLRLDR